MICGDCIEFNKSYGICKKTKEGKSVWSECNKPL